MFPAPNARITAMQQGVAVDHPLLCGLQERYRNPRHPGLVDPLLALAAVELRQDDTASWQR